LRFLMKGLGMRSGLGGLMADMTRGVFTGAV
jgi:hypothetical protein